MSCYQMQPFTRKGFRSEGEPFAYQRLNPSNSEIRLVTILPGAWRSRIRCKIHIASLNSGPEYETLSYVWGDATYQYPIFVDDKIFWITANLWVALRRLRGPEPRVLWIDAICINQQDDEEKSHQVAMMKDIYHACQRAVLWLGEDYYSTRKRSRPQPTSKRTRNAFSALKMFARANGHFNETPRFEVDPQTRLAKSVAAFFKPFIDELDYILSEDWWKRVWIVQDAAVSPRAVFAYASERLPISVWQRAYAWYKQHSAGCCRIHISQMRHSLADARLLNILAVCMERLDRVLSARADFRSGEEVSLYRLRYNFNMQQATDRRDLIYALLGLVNDWGSVAPVTPDYSQPPVQVFSRAALAMVEISQSLGALRGRRSLDRDRTHPSWLPDWLVFPMSLYESANQENWFEPDVSALVNAYFEVPVLTKDFGLMVRSFDLGTVAVVSNCIGSWEQFLTEIFIWKQLVESFTSAGLRQNMACFWDAMLCGQVRTSIEDPESPGQVADSHGRVEFRPCTEADFAHCCSAMAKLEKLLADGWRDETIQHHIPYIHEIFVEVHERRMFITEGGKVGLARQEIRNGDQIRDLCGGELPFVLRPMSCRSELSAPYSVVGECYLACKPEDQVNGQEWEDKPDVIELR